MNPLVDLLLFGLALCIIVMALLVRRLAKALWAHCHPKPKFILHVAFGEQQSPPDP